MLIWKKLKTEIGQNDLWLAVFFAILLIHMAMSMIFPLETGDAKAGIDVVTRTATALLAGYFISKNFIAKKPANYIESAKRTRHIFQTNVIAVIGLFCLFLLVLIRYTKPIEVSATTLSQVRDLFLASTAFLMGTANE